MSELILPPGLILPEAIRQKEAPDEAETPEQRNQALPKPTGWKILCAVPTINSTFEGTSIIKADTVVRNEELTTTTLFVVALGPLAYKDKEKFTDGQPWCKPGDFVITRAYAGTRLQVFGREFRLLNDDQIDAVVDDPRGISRV